MTIVTIVIKGPAFDNSLPQLRFKIRKIHTQLKITSMRITNAVLKNKEC